MRIITVNLSDHDFEALGKLVMEDKFPSKRDAIRVAIRDLLINELHSRDWFPTEYPQRVPSRIPEPPQKHLPF